MAEQDEVKRRAARAALAHLPEEGVLGLGTGSTACHFVDAVGELVRAGRKYAGVPTSERSRQQALSLGIPLLSDEGPWEIDVCVDGADEVSADLDLIKGGGAAHTREKIVNYASRLNIIVVDSSKLSTRLGEKWPIPIEVLAYGHKATERLLAAYGQPALRMTGGQPTKTDAGNVIYDLHVEPIKDAGGLAGLLALVPGVVGTGLFVGRADIVLVAGQDGIRTLERPRGAR